MSKASLRSSHMGLPPSFYSFPRTRTDRQKLGVNPFLGLKMRFFSLPKIILFFASIFSWKDWENHGFWPPKTVPKSFQNAFKNDVPKNMQFFIDFCSKNALLQKCRHWFSIGFCSTKWLSDNFLQIAFCMHFRFIKKLTKNLSKTMSEPLKNRWQKRVVFQHRFFHVLASILASCGPPNWSQVGYFGHQTWRI